MVANNGVDGKSQLHAAATPTAELAAAEHTGLMKLKRWTRRRAAAVVLLLLLMLLLLLQVVAVDQMVVVMTAGGPQTSLTGLMMVQGHGGQGHPVRGGVGLDWPQLDLTRLSAKFTTRRHLMSLS